MVLGDVVFGAVAAAAIVFCLAPLAAELGRRAGYVALPNERTMHVGAIPRSGGFAILGGIGTALLLSRDVQLVPLASAVCVAAALATVDEIRGVSRRARLLVQVAVALALVASTSGLQVLEPSFAGTFELGLAGFLLAIIWLLSMINIYNFMDGINGIASVQAVITGTALAVLLLRAGDPSAAVVAAGTAGTACGFMPWNLPRARLFMGDVGSTGFGIVFGFLVLRTAAAGTPFVVAVLPLAPFLFDSFVTLGLRIRRGESFFSTPHRSHFYQRLVVVGWSHSAVASTWGLLAAASAAVALQYEWLPPLVQGIALFAIIGGMTMGAWAIHTTWIRHTKHQTLA